MRGFDFTTTGLLTLQHGGFCALTLSATTSHWTYSTAIYCIKQQDFSQYKKDCKLDLNLGKTIAMDIEIQKCARGETQQVSEEDGEP